MIKVMRLAHTCTHVHGCIVHVCRQDVMTDLHSECHMILHTPNFCIAFCQYFI